MKVHIIVTDEHGRTFEGEALLSLRHITKQPVSRRKAPRSKEPQSGSVREIDFTLPARAFVRKYVRNMGGPQKFTLLISWLAKGKMEPTVDLQRIRHDWNRMTQLMGGKFNRAYATRASDNGWVEAPKKGVYRLRPSWNEIFSR